MQDSRVAAGRDIRTDNGVAAIADPIHSIVRADASLAERAIPSRRRSSEPSFRDRALCVVLEGQADQRQLMRDLAAPTGKGPAGYYTVTERFPKDPMPLRPIVKSTRHEAKECRGGVDCLEWSRQAANSL